MDTLMKANFLLNFNFVWQVGREALCPLLGPRRSSPPAGKNPLQNPYVGGWRSTTGLRRGETQVNITLVNGSDGHVDIFIDIDR